MSSALVSIAFAIELLIKFVFPMLNMPFGGNFIGLSMLPMVIVGYLYGLRYGIIAGFVYGLFEILFAPSGYIVGWSFLLDYLVGFTAYGLTGLFAGKLGSVRHVVYGVLLAGCVRYLSVSMAGVIFWSEVFNADAFFYSFVTYNLGYNLSTTALTLTLLLLIRKRILLLNEAFLKAS